MRFGVAGGASHSVFAFLLYDVLRVLQHFLLPQVKEVGGIGVKLQGFSPIIPFIDIVITVIRQ